MRSSLNRSAELSANERDLDIFDDVSTDDPGDEFGLTCPSCDFVLTGNPLFEEFRVCPECHRHFWIPARERVALVADPETFRETNTDVVSIDPLVFQDAWPVDERSTAHLSAGESVVTGRVTIGGHDAMLVVVDMAMTLGSIGIVTGEKICLAFEEAANRRVPLIAICSGGVQADSDSVLTFAQNVRIAAVVGRLQRNGVPLVSVLTHPTTGAFFTGLGNHGNIIFAEPAAQLGFGASRAASRLDLGTASSEELLAGGMIDGIVERTALRERLVTALDLLTSRNAPRIGASPVWSSVPRGRGSDDPALVRVNERPSPADYIDELSSGFIEIRGDRTGTVDPHLVAGIGQIDGVTIGLIGVSRGPLSADGFRTVVRLYRLAGQLEFPIVVLIDAPGPPETSAMAGAALSNAIAQSMRIAVSLPIPIVSIVTGVASGPGSMALTIADRVYMLEHAIFSNRGLDRPTQPGIAPNPTAGLSGARECLRLGIIDGVIPEPAGGAHADMSNAARQLRLSIVQALAELNGLGHRRLLDERNRRLRHLGLSTPAGREALHIEIAQLHEIQQSLGRSIDELRGRLELHQLGLPNLPSLPQRPALGPRPPLPQIDLQLPTRPALPTMRRLTRNRSEMSHLAERFAATRRGITERMHDVRATLEPPDESPPKEHTADD
ncbi:MAG: hypothetical protein M9947_17445 [Thermomicrobiales bacterium]|nr:hypothetical protein [Thermomicrobiales bacterium]